MLTGREEVVRGAIELEAPAWGLLSREAVRPLHRRLQSPVAQQHERDLEDLPQYPRPDAGFAVDHEFCSVAGDLVEDHAATQHASVQQTEGMRRLAKPVDLARRPLGDGTVMPDQELHSAG